MKYLLMCIFCTLLLGCELEPQKRIESKNVDDFFKVVVIDSCEYVTWYEDMGYKSKTGICHKGNCKKCKKHE